MTIDQAIDKIKTMKPGTEFECQDYKPEGYRLVSLTTRLRAQKIARVLYPARYGTVDQPARERSTWIRCTPDEFEKHFHPEWCNPEERHGTTVTTENNGEIPITPHHSQPGFKKAWQEARDAWDAEQHAPRPQQTIEDAVASLRESFPRRTSAVCTVELAILEVRVTLHGPLQQINRIMSALEDL